MGSTETSATTRRIGPAADLREATERCAQERHNEEGSLHLQKAEADRAEASALSAFAFPRRTASSSLRFSCAFRSVAYRRSAAGSIRRVVADVSVDPMTEAAVTLSRVRGALKLGKQAKDSDKATKKQ